MCESDPFIHPLLHPRRDEDAPAKIADEDAVKPEGWLDDEAEYIGDPDAVKPEDWYVISNHIHSHEKDIENCD